jgi:tetratricopeptide (TPR) repeat protein
LSQHLFAVEWLVGGLVMRAVLAFSLLLASTSLSSAEVGQDCRSADPAKAISGCTIFLQQSGSSKADQAFAHILRADAFVTQGQFDAAVKDLEKAFQLAPNSASGLMVRGRLHFRRAEYKKALADVDAVLRQTPNAVSARRLRGIVQMELTNYSEAKKDFDWVIANSPTDATALANRGRLHRLQNNNDLSLADLDRAVTLSPKWTWPLLQRADTYQLKGDYQRAIADYDRVLAITPNDADVQRRRTAAMALLKPGAATAPQSPSPPANVEQALQQARWMLDRNDAAGAYRITNELLKSNPGLADAYLLRGRAFHLERMYTQAIEDLSKYVGMKPTDVAGYYMRGLVHADLGRSAEAMADANEIGRLAPTDTRGQNLRGWTHLIAERHAQAEEEFSAAIKIRPSDLLHVNRAMARMELGRYGDAEADLRDAYALNARSARVLATKGQLLVRTGRIEEGEASFRDALAIDPNYVTARVGQQALYAAQALKQLKHLPRSAAVSK